MGVLLENMFIESVGGWVASVFGFVWGICE